MQILGLKKNIIFRYLYASTLGFVPDSLFDSVNVINSGGRCGTYNFATKTIEMISCDGTEAAIICISKTKLFQTKNILNH